MQGGGFPVSEEDFDAIVVCNGHYSNVRRAELPGAESFPGTIVHSHSYRDNQAFEGLTVIVIGASASGEDICREISLTANKVDAPCITPCGASCNLRHRHISVMLRRGRCPLRGMLSHLPECTGLGSGHTMATLTRVLKSIKQCFVQTEIKACRHL